MSTFLLFLLLLAVAAVLYFLIKFLSQRRRSRALDQELQAQRSKYTDDHGEWTKRISDLERENQSLSRWKNVADADQKANELIQSAQATLSKASENANALMVRSKQDAETLLSAAKSEAEESVSAARADARKMREEARTSLDSSTQQASTIVENAHKRAEEIAGSAYEAMNKASLYEETVKAMKNLIDGYGDQYIIPGRSLLDDLADDYEHTEAGKELKKAQERSKYMIRNGTAATCDYVEENRRTTAINFVTDAFNGKVASILSRVKHDNAGTLEQQIQDAFTLVNFNGKAFRDARISEEYLNARLDELKWAAIAQQLRLDEREEQRRIKEQIREEQKAQREFEKAIREAAKEEDLLRKAMEKAQQQIKDATDEQRVRYEKQLEELSAKLKEAEERNQRAISMAQQTKRGHVYIISNIGSFGESVYKIGLTRRLTPFDRVRELGDSSVPFEFDVHAMIFSEDAPALEHSLHNHFRMMQMNKVNYRKEFFRVDLKLLREEVQKKGLEAKWTMTADAREYRETQAIEKAIKEDPEKREAWLNRQLELETVGGTARERLAALADD